ncbi:hypothetical protein EAF00_006346 [Botryotinia globosa]|nr:hypothetical protein EAF00_006346 [Botryotinia globosa]
MEKLETTGKSRAIDPIRIGNDHSEAFALFASLGPEFRIAICELAVAAATPALPELIFPFQNQPELPEDCLESAKWADYQSITTPNLSMTLNTTRFSRIPKRGIENLWHIICSNYQPNAIPPLTRLSQFP